MVVQKHVIVHSHNQTLWPDMFPSQTAIAVKGIQSLSNELEQAPWQILKEEILSTRKEGGQEGR